MKRGFTLIELLVAVIIIGVLTRIALPQYRRVAQKAHVVEAQSMLRTLYNSSERLAAEFGATDFPSLYEEYTNSIDASKRERIKIAKMDMFDTTDEGEGTFKFACKVNDFTIKCKNWTYTLLNKGTGDKAAYVLAKDKDDQTELSLRRSDMKWGCRSIHEGEEGKKGKELCAAYDIEDINAPSGDY